MNASKILTKYEFPQRPIFFQGNIEGYETQYSRDREMSVTALSKEEVEQAFREQLTIRGFNAAHHFAIRRFSVKTNDSVVHHHFRAIGYPAIVFRTVKAESADDVHTATSELEERHRKALLIDHTENQFTRRRARLLSMNFWWGAVAPLSAILANFFVLEEPIPWFGWVAGAVVIASVLYSPRIGNREFNVRRDIDWQALHSPETKERFAQLVDEYSLGVN